MNDDKFLISMDRLANSYLALEQIGNLPNAPFKISYWAKKNRKLLVSDYEIFIARRNELFENYLNLIDNAYGEYKNGVAIWNYKQGMEKEFHEKMNELINHKVEIHNPYLLKIDDTLLNGDFNISTNYLELLDYLIED